MYDSLERTFNEKKKRLHLKTITGGINKNQRYGELGT